MQGLGRILIGMGLLLLVAGGVAVLLGKTGLPLGRLLGDIRYDGKHFSFYFPLATCLLLSVLVSVVLYLLSHWRR
uniref:DUF2905 domain-containing protein n=1 Tax=Acidobacterium capsulatum TaxID=33075 RepID=A0A7V4XS88_9BACT